MKGRKINEGQKSGGKSTILKKSGIPQKNKGSVRAKKKTLREFVFFLFLSPLKKRQTKKNERKQKKSPLFPRKSENRFFHPI